MDIEDFEMRISELIPKDEESGLFEKDLELWVHADGCLGSRYDGASIRSEGLAWDDALDVIIKFIESVELV